MKIQNDSDVFLINVPLDRAVNKRKEISKLSSMPPLGQLYLVSYLSQHNYRVSFVDLAVELFEKEQFEAALNQARPRIVGISTYVESWNIQNSLVKKIKYILPDAIIVGGGHCATFKYEKMLDEGFDYLIRGEGEETLLRLCEFLIKKVKGVKRSDISGLVYKENEKLIVNDMERICNLEKLPFPDRTVLDFGRYSYPFTISTARGCPGRCIFCSSYAFWGSKVKIRSAEHIYSEIVGLYNQFGTKDFFIVDDTFTFIPNRTLKFCELLIDYAKSNNIEFSWGCESRADVVNHELLEKMHLAGCQMIQFGMESGNNGVLKSIQKKIQYTDIETAVHIAFECGIKTNVSIMIGHHSDTKETVEETLSKAQDLYNKYKANILFAITTPYPGTELREKLEEYGAKLLINDDAQLQVERPSMQIKNLTVNQVRKYYDLAQHMFKLRDISE